MKKGHVRPRKERHAWHPSPEQKRAPPPRVEPPRRVRVPAMPSVTLVPEPGSWLWTCRAGFEGPLFEELAWGKKNPVLLGPALVAHVDLASPHSAQLRSFFPSGIEPR